MLISNRLSRLIREGKPALGMWVNLCDPGVVQLAALAGYDWVIIDNEHNPLTEAQVQGMLHAVGGYDVQTIVRVRANREEHVKWVLDSGAGGVIIPGARDAADARRAVEICKYHPLGSRGYGPNRASGYWTRGKEYTASANEEILLICQIELASAVAEVDEICRIDGIDGFWIGPTDLAQSLGHLGDAENPEVVAAIDRIIEAANRHGMPWGMPIGSVEACKSHVERGGTIIVLGSDSRMIRQTGSGLVEKARNILDAHGLRGKQD